jgi:hypothetical protein
VSDASMRRAEREARASGDPVALRACEAQAQRVAPDTVYARCHGCLGLRRVCVYAMHAWDAARQVARPMRSVVLTTDEACERCGALTVAAVSKGAGGTL